MNLQVFAVYSGVTCTFLIIFITSFIELDHDESDENARLEEQANLLDDYTPLDPTYLPAGLGEDDNKVSQFIVLNLKKRTTRNPQFLLCHNSHISVLHIF